MEIIKYPRTRHLSGSRIQFGDEMLSVADFAEIAGKYVVLEEKVDGANTGISFDENGELLLQSRGHFLNGGYGEKQFSLLKTWANCFYTPLYQLLGNRYLMYGEWLYAKHTVFYDRLPHYFMEFDIYDKEKKLFLSTKQRRRLLNNAPFICSVLVLYEGMIQTKEQLESYLGKSHFKSAQFQSVLKQQCDQFGQSYELVKSQTDNTDFMEGIYIKVENDTQVLDRMKYVRSSFIHSILDSQTHWSNRPILPNKLLDTVNMFQQEVKND